MRAYSLPVPCGLMLQVGCSPGCFSPGGMQHERGSTITSPACCTSSWLAAGDLWSGNIAALGGSSTPVIFDPATYYGHHEAEWGMRCVGCGMLTRAGTQLVLDCWRMPSRLCIPTQWAPSAVSWLLPNPPTRHAGLNRAVLRHSTLPTIAGAPGSAAPSGAHIMSSSLGFLASRHEPTCTSCTTRWVGGWAAAGPSREQ